MAKLVIDRKRLMKNVTMHVEIKGGWFGPFDWRRHAGVAFIKAAAWVLGMPVEVRVEPEDEPRLQEPM